MKNLENLKEFQIDNQEELSVIEGGLAAGSKKKDTNSQTADSATRDTYDIGSVG